MLSDFCTDIITDKIVCCSSMNSSTSSLTCELDGLAIGVTIQAAAVYAQIFIARYLVTPLPVVQNYKTPNNSPTEEIKFRGFAKE